MQEIHDKVCEFISRYKQHIEPAQRSSEIMCVEKCNNELLKQDKEISTLKSSLLESQSRYDMLIEDVNKARKDILIQLNFLKELFNNLTREICEAVDVRKYREIDTLMYDIREIFNKLDEIPEF